MYNADDAANKTVAQPVETNIYWSENSGGRVTKISKILNTRHNFLISKFQEKTKVQKIVALKYSTRINLIVPMLTTHLIFKS